MNERSIFIGALEIEDQTQRDAYLDQMCGGDSGTRARVVSLLAATSESEQLLESPPADLLLAEEPLDTEDASRTVIEDRVPLGSREQLMLEYLQPSSYPGASGALGPYELLQRVGEGGMGVVYRALDTTLNRVVAVKILAPEFAANPNARQRFLREAHTAAAINHGHVVTIHSVDEAKLPYLVMEFVQGRSLQERLDASGPPPLCAILRIASQIAAGLAAAHREGVIHRDIKPGNILLENGIERVKITDFGLARAADDVAITRSGFIAGTPQYMSPEQAHGEQIDARSDLFSLGSVIYAMCTGRPPFRAETTVGVLKRVCEDTPRPIHEINPEIPAWLEAIVGKLLEKRPQDRFQTAHEVAEILTQCLAHVQNPAMSELPERLHDMLQTPVKAPPAKISPEPSPSLYYLNWPAILFSSLVAIALVMVLVMSGIGYWLKDEGTLIVTIDDPEVRVSINGREVEIGKSQVEQFPLPPGQYRIIARRDGQVIRTELANIVHGEKTLLDLRRTPPTQTTIPEMVTGAEDTRSPMLRRARSLGVAGFRPNWTPDGKYILLSRNDETAIDLIDAADGRREVAVDVADFPAEESEIGVADGVVSPDGKLLAFVKRPRGNDRDKYFKEEVWLMPREKGVPRRIASGGYPSWGEDAGTLYIHDRSRNILQRVDLQGSLATITDLFPCPTWYPVVAPNGKQVAFNAGNQVRIVDLATGDEVQVWSLPGPVSGMLLNWSPDSSELCLSPYHDQQRSGLWLYDLAANQGARITKEVQGEGAWSRSTSEFAFTSRNQLFVVALHAQLPTAKSLLEDSDPENVETFVDREHSLTAAQLRELLAQASGISTKQWQTLAGDMVGPDMAAITGTPLTLLLFERNPRQEAMFNHEIIKDFWYLSPTIPPPGRISEAISIHADKGYVSFLQPGYVTDIETTQKDATLFGEVDLVCPKLYTGRVRFVARKHDGQWRIEGFQLPHYRLAIKLEDNVWRKIAWKEADWHTPDTSAEAIPVPANDNSENAAPTPEIPSP